MLRNPINPRYPFLFIFYFVLLQKELKRYGFK